jgi:hypothetical protein
MPAFQLSIYYFILYVGLILFLCRDIHFESVPFKEFDDLLI